MEDLTRREALKLTATAGAMTTGLLAAAETAEASPQAPSQPVPKDVIEKAKSYRPDREAMKKADEANPITKFYFHNEFLHFTITGWLHCLPDDKTYTTGHISGVWFGLLGGEDYYLDKNYSTHGWNCDYDRHKITVTLYKEAGVWKVAFVQWKWNESARDWEIELAAVLATCA